MEALRYSQDAVLTAQNVAKSLAESLIVAYYLRGHSNHSSDYHLSVAAGEFAKLAEQFASMAAAAPCANHPDQPSVTNLDGDDLCQECADAWVRSEGDAFAYREAQEAEVTQ